MRAQYVEVGELIKQRKDAPKPLLERQQSDQVLKLERELAKSQADKVFLRRRMAEQVTGLSE